MTQEVLTVKLFATNTDVKRAATSCLHALDKDSCYSRI